MASATGFDAVPSFPPAPSLAKAIVLLAKAKRAANLRPRYVAGLARYLRQFAKGRESASVASLTAATVAAWFDSRVESPATRASNIGRIKSLLAFATRKGWLLPVRLDLERVRIEAKPPRILTPAEAGKLLAMTRKHAPEALPVVALGLFAGVRPEEARQLEWGALELDAGHVTVSAAASKVRQRRIVPLAAVAVEWLRLGGALPLKPSTARRRLRAVRVALGWPAWPQDLLRHTAASYLLAREQDAPRVALWLGNSPAILLRHYRELVSKAAAAEFWALRP